MWRPITKVTWAVAWIAAVNTTLAASVHSSVQRLYPRQQQQQPPLVDPSLDQQYKIYQQAFTDPVGAALAANQLPYIAQQQGTGNLWQYNIAGDGVNLPWNQAIPFQPEATVSGNPDQGWQSLPDLPAFNLNRSLVIKNGATQPFYISQRDDYAKIKRAVIILPGKSRDCWKYSGFMQNALNIVAADPDSGVHNDSVLIIGPCWFSEPDVSAGAAHPTDLFFTKSNWQAGYKSTGPGQILLSSYEILDFFLDMLFDKRQFPSLNRVVLAGHSMGGQMVQRYALLKKSKPYDSNVAFWIGNPGSYAWLSSDRPFPNTTCEQPDQWAYGLGNVSAIPAYAKDDAKKGQQSLVDRFRSRNLHYNYGLLDNGPGDTSCQARLQGANHLERGCKLIESLANMKSGFPTNHTVNFLPLVSHIEYIMLSYNSSLQRIFIDGFNTSNPLLPPSAEHNNQNNGIRLFGSLFFSFIVSGVVIGFTLF